MTDSVKAQAGTPAGPVKQDQPVQPGQVRWRERLSPWLMTLGGFLLWEAVCRVFRIPSYVLPTPSVILATFAEFRRALIVNSIQTLWTTLAGFGIAVGFGLLLGLIIGWSKTIYNGLYPMMIGFNCVPKVAVVPILVLWFGIGSPPAILTAFLISFFPIVVNVGIGHMMLIAQANFEVPLVFAGLFALAAQEIGMYAAFAWLERRLTGWAFRRDAAGA